MVLSTRGVGDMLGESGALDLPPIDVALQLEVERFLFVEARLADTHAYDDWLKLWSGEALYWIPCNEEDADPKRNVSIAYDRRPQLEARIMRLKSKFAFSQQPKTRLQRVISNVVIERITDEYIWVTSAFSLGDLRPNQETHYYGRTLHVLERHHETFVVRQKKVVLLNLDRPIGNLTYLM